MRIIPIETIVRKREKSKPTNLKKSLNNFQISQPATTREIVPPERDNNPKNAIQTTTATNFMMIPEPREFCFSMFFSFLIILTFFLRHPSRRSFFVSRA